jgi:hypothetical protein
MANLSSSLRMAGYRKSSSLFPELFELASLHPFNYTFNKAMQMPLKKHYIATSLLLIMLATLGFLVTRPKEPSFEGKTLTEWLSQYHQERSLLRAFTIDVPQHSNSVRAIRAISTNCIPTLLKWMDAKDVPGVIALESGAAPALE